MKLVLNSKKLSIKVLLALLITVLFVLTGIVFGLYFHNRIKVILVSELNERGKALAKNLAANSRYGVITEDEEILSGVLDDVIDEKDVAFIMITDTDGRILIGKSSENEANIKIPSDVTNKVFNSNNSRIIPFSYDDSKYVCVSSPIRLAEGAVEPSDSVPGSYGGTGGKSSSMVKKGYAVIAFTLEHTLGEVANISKTVAIFIVLITSIGVLVSLTFIKAVIKPIENIIDVTGRIADGDVTIQVEKTGFKEYAGLQESINKISGRLREILNRLLCTSQEITAATDSIQDTSEHLFEGAKEQSSSVSSASISMNEMNEAIKLNSVNIARLSTSANLTSASMKKMVDSIDAVSTNTNTLYDSINNSSSSIIQMTSSIKEIAKSTDELSNIMATTSVSIKEMDQMISMITDISADACELSEQVKKNASDLGLKSIERMSASMDKIKESVEDSTSTIKKLGATSGKIGEILTVIEGVTEQTGLLALNAAILAAQAGKHGKGFAVVADEIKALADRTATSTKEIANIIKGIQEDVESSVTAVSIGRDNVTEGVKQTDAVVKAFESIYSSASSSVNKASDIKSYSLAQSQKVISIKKSIEMMSNMVHHVVKATKEQKNASEHIMKMTEKISHVTTNIKDTIIEQSSQSKHISKSINDVTDGISAISAAISEAAKGTENIVTETNKIKTITSKNTEYNNELYKVVRRLSELSRVLKDELKHFKL